MDRTRRQTMWRDASDRQELQLLLRPLTWRAGAEPGIIWPEVAQAPSSVSRRRF